MENGSPQMNESEKQMLADLMPGIREYARDKDNMRKQNVSLNAYVAAFAVTKGMIQLPVFGQTTQVELPDGIQKYLESLERTGMAAIEV